MQMQSLERMVERQRILADFGEFALRSEGLEEILHEACRLVCDALDADLAKILEIQPGKDCVLVKAGVGWRPGIVGEKQFKLSARTSEAYSIRAARPVFTKDIRREDRFEFPDWLKDHGVVASVNAPIFLPGGEPYGLLQVDSREPRGFGDEDAEFLRTYCIVLGPVIDRLHKVHSLHQALETNKRLLQELQHRVKNHMAMTASLIRMGVRQTESEDARRALEQVGERVEALRLVNEQLYAAGAADRVRLRPYLMQLLENLCHNHEADTGKVQLDFAIDDRKLSTDQAVPLGLILNEFVTNSLKYAFDGRHGAISVSFEGLGNGRFRLRVADNGRGLPTQAGADAPQASTGTGMKLIEGLARQIGAKPNWLAPERGAALCLEFEAL